LWIGGTFKIHTSADIPLVWENKNKNLYYYLYPAQDSSTHQIYILPMGLSAHTHIGLVWKMGRILNTRTSQVFKKLYTPVQHWNKAWTLELAKL
jgi:hypothetical protein